LNFSIFLTFASGTYVSVRSLASFFALKYFTSIKSEDNSGLYGASMIFYSNFLRSKLAKNGCAKISSPSPFTPSLLDLSFASNYSY
jgi:hypothetical protein